MTAMGVGDGCAADYVIGIVKVANWIVAMVGFLVLGVLDKGILILYVVRR